MDDRVAPLRERLRSRTVTVGTFLSLGSPLAAEACALAGFDWLLVDLEHGAGDEVVLASQIMAAQVHGVPVIVRSETAERIRVGRALDLGAVGIMLPRLDLPEQVGTALSHLRYPPSGDRGVASYNRSRRFGLDQRSLPVVDADVVGIVQIESTESLLHVEAIAAIPDLDVLFVGPGDLSYALGVPGRFEDPVFLDALDLVIRAADAHGVSAGILANTAEMAERYAERGFTFVGIGSDATLLTQAAVASRARIRPSAPAGGTPARTHVPSSAPAPEGAPR